jgi:RNA polymerase sigma-70 factor (ECF subfamily)
MDEVALAAMVERACAGEADAFAELYRQYWPRVFGLCRHLLRTAAAAEDAASEVFLRVQRNLGSYDRSRPFLKWLLAIASNHCMDLLRRTSLETRLFGPGQEEPLSEPAASAGTSPLEQVIAGEQRGRLQQALRRLSGKHRRVLVLRYASELSYDEIAQALRIERTHVGVLIFRAKQELRRLALGERKRP